jgi:hypothetical protein
MNWELGALKLLARNASVPGVALADACGEIDRLNKRVAYLVDQTKKACSLATRERPEELAKAYLADWDEIHRQVDARHELERRVLDVMCAINQAITYDNEEEAKKGRYGLPVSVCQKMNDLIQLCHDWQDEANE